jgi:hypothetical protein
VHRTGSPPKFGRGQDEPTSFLRLIAFIDAYLSALFARFEKEMPSMTTKRLTKNSHVGRFSSVVLRFGGQQRLLLRLRKEGLGAVNA